jgi:phospholipase/carboxylesterase
LSPLAFQERPAAGAADGLLVLHHGRGTSEQDLLPLGDALDPERRLHVVAPQAPLSLAGAPGYHWYLVPRVGHPDRDTFDAARRELGEFHDQLWQRTGIDPLQTILGGFSMGSVMSYTLGLAAGRPATAGILAFSGFLPTVAGWRADVESRAGLAVFIAHGTHDPVIDVAFGREAAARLRDGGLAVEYRESAVAHEIDPAQLAPARAWLAAALPAEPAAGADI